MIPFHILDVHLDDDLDVCGVTALMDLHDLDALNQLIYPDTATDAERLQILDRVRIEPSQTSRDELLVHLDTRELMRLYRRVNRSDTPDLPGAWDSLYRVVRNLIEPDESPAMTWDEHQRPDGAIWRGYLDEESAPELVGLGCRMDPDGDQGAVKVSFFDGTVLHLDKDTRFRILRTARPAPPVTRTDPDAVAALQDLIRGLVLGAGDQTGDVKTIADTVASQITDHFSPCWDRAVNHDEDVTESRGRIPEDPNRYRRRLMLWGTEYRDDPTGQEYHNELWQGLQASHAHSRWMAAASRRIGPAKDGKIPVRVGRAADDLVLFNVGSRTVASVAGSPAGRAVPQAVAAVTAVANAYGIKTVDEATGEPVTAELVTELPDVRAVVERIVQAAGPDGISWVDLHAALTTGGQWGPGLPVSKVSLSKLLKKPGTTTEPVEWLANRTGQSPYVHVSHTARTGPVHYPDLLPRSILNPLPVGVLRGSDTEVGVNLRMQSAFLWGGHGSGRTVTLADLIAGGLQCVDTLVWVIDLDGGSAAAPFLTGFEDGHTDRPCIDWVATDIGEARRMTQTALAIAADRKRYYRKLMQEANTNLMPVGNGDPGQAPPEILIVVANADLLPGRAAQNDDANDVRDAMHTLTRTARAAGVTHVATALRATADHADPAYAAYATARIGMRVTDQQELAYGFGDWRLTPPDNQTTGSGLIRARAGESAEQFDAYYLDPQRMNDIGVTTTPWRPYLDDRGVHIGGQMYADRWIRTADRLFDNPRSEVAAYDGLTHPAVPTLEQIRARWETATEKPF